MKILEYFSQDQNPNKPKIIRKGGNITKKFDKYNKNLIKLGFVENYIDDSLFFNPTTNRFIKKQYDTRYKDKKIVKKSQLKKLGLIKKNIIFGNKFISSEITMEKGETQSDFKQKLKDNNILNGNYRFIAKFKKFDFVDFDDDLLEDNIIFEERFFDNTFFIGNSISKWWKKDLNKFRFGESGAPWIWDTLPQGDKIVFIITKETNIRSKIIHQFFRDGKNYYCFYSQILNYFNEKLENSKSKTQKKAYQEKINYIQGRQLKHSYKDGLIQKYNGSMPEDKNILSELCNKLNIGVDIEQPFLDETFIKVRPLKQVRKVFRYINSRLNHLEPYHEKTGFNKIYSNDYKEKKYRTRHELDQLIINLQKEDKFFIYQKDTFGVSCIKTNTDYYCLNDDYFTQANNFDNEINLTDNFNIDYLKNPNEAKFINSSNHYNCTTDFIDNVNLLNYEEEKIKHIDLKKAYTQFENCEFYNGFLGIITDGLRKCTSYKKNGKIQKGLYQITNLNFNKNPKFFELNEKLNIYNNEDTYYDFDLVFLEKNNITFDVIAGIKGEKFDFKFNEIMKNTKSELIEINGEITKLPYYSKWAGMLGRVSYHKHFYMRGDSKYFENLRTKAEIWESENDNEKRITYKKKIVNSKKHITAQITSYQRINMIQQLLNMNLNKIIRVVSDGIYFYEHDFKLKENLNFHIEKTKKPFLHNYYLNDFLSYDDDTDFKILNKERQYNKIEVHCGGGGSGKTHYNLTDKGLINVCYIAPSWKLSILKGKEHNCKNNVVARFTRKDLPYWVDLMKQYSNLVIDEGTMINEEEKQFFIKNFKGRIIFCGDFGFQLPPIQGKEMKINNYPCIKHEKLYRFKCEKLLKLIKKIRTVRQKEINFGVNFDKYELIYNKFQNITFDQVKKIYNKKDLIITSQNNFIDEIDKVIKEDKFLVMNNTSLYKNGEILLQDPKINGVELKKTNAFTIHKIQGETTENKLFIDKRNIKSLRMLYTAISRARYYNQIYFF